MRSFELRVEQADDLLLLGEGGEVMMWSRMGWSQAVWASLEGVRLEWH